MPAEQHARERAEARDQEADEGFRRRDADVEEQVAAHHLLPERRRDRRGLADEELRDERAGGELPERQNGDEQQQAVEPHPADGGTGRCGVHDAAAARFGVIRSHSSAVIFM